MKFRDLGVGQSFDFIGPDPTLNSFYARCVKLSTRTYAALPSDGDVPPMEVGSINCEVYHVENM